MRRLLLKIFFAIGGFRLWRYFKRNDVTILCLHGVMDEEVDSAWVPLRAQYPRDTLDKSLGLLKKYYNFVSLEHALAMILGEKKIEPNTMVLTFDDGYYNNLRHALPILKKHSVPSVMYVACGQIEERTPFWFDRLDYAIQHADLGVEEFVINGEKIEIDGSNRHTLRKSFKSLRDLAKRGDRDDAEMASELEALSAQLEARSGRRLTDIFEKDDWSGVMTWQQIAAISTESLVEVGSHTVNHIRLGKVKRDVVMHELSASKAILEEKTAAPCRHFCYPDGSLNNKTPQYLRDAEYDSAVTTIPGTNPVSTDPMQLKRIHLPESDDPLTTLLVASGLADAIDNVRG